MSIGRQRKQAAGTVDWHPGSLERNRPDYSKPHVGSIALKWEGNTPRRAPAAMAWAMPDGPS